MNDIWATIPTWLAIVTALIAIGGLIQESKLTKFTLAADLLVRLEDKFDEAPMVKRRKTAARALLCHQDYDKVTGVLYFFEEIGILLEKGALDPELVYNEFSYWAIAYWTACQEYISQRRSADPTWFSAYASLVSRMNKRTSKHGPYLPSAGELKEFLEDESALIIC